MTGGIIDIYIFHASLANVVLRRYHTFIGAPCHVPFWAMGFHHSNDSFKTTS